MAGGTRNQPPAASSAWGPQTGAARAGASARPMRSGPRARPEQRARSLAFVDVEAAFEALHRAQSHVANGEWAAAWGPSGVA